MYRWASFAVIVVVALGVGRPVSARSGSWRVFDPGFRVLDITNGPGDTLWICGSDASIAESNDGGAHWTVRDQEKDGGVLLFIRFRGQFGYAGGTTGYIAFSDDGGATWTHSVVPYKDVLLGSFFNATHGLLRTRTAVLSTTNGKTWSSVSGRYASEFAKFPYVMGLAVLDEKHMAIHLSEPPPSESGFLSTEDGGANWRILEIPDTTITSLQIHDGKYWAVGTEVIDKDKPGGGHAVPLALSSTDGEKWEHTQHNISVCQWEGCGEACTDQGCLAASGLVANIYNEEVDRIVFPPNADFTVNWAMTPKAICFVGAKLECTDTRTDPSADPHKMPGSTPTADEQPLARSIPKGSVQCILCKLNPMFVDGEPSGLYRLKTSFEINRNGMVSDIKIEGAPSKKLQEKVRNSMMGWVFEPILRNGVSEDLKINTTLGVMVIGPPQ